MKKKLVLLSLLALMATEKAMAACGPPECCTHPHICGKGPKVETFSDNESACLQKSANSVDGDIYFSPAGYPHSIRNSWQDEMAKVDWANGICQVTYNSGYHRD